jgi:amino acid transporter
MAATRVDAPPAGSSVTTPAGRPTLRTHALGFPTLLAQSIGVISPTMTAVLIIPLAFSYAGQGTWFAYAFGTVMLMFVVFGLNQFAKRSASAGSMYGYTARGLGPAAGVFSGWTLIWSYMFIAIAGLSGFAVFAQQFLDAVGVHIGVTPVFLFVISGSLCWFVAYKDIRISSMLTLALEAISVSCIAILAFIILFKHGFSVDTEQIKLQGMGLHGIGLAVVVSIFSLVGFESATTLGGEAKRPLRNVPRAVIWSLAFAGLWFVFMSYVEVAGSRHAGTSLANMGAPLITLARLYGVSAFKIPISLGAMISFFGLSLTCINAGARIIFPMAQHMVFPSHLGKVHHTNKTPHVAITIYVGVILAIPILLSAFTNPLTIFDDAGTLAAFGFLTAYFLISIAAPAYLRKRGEIKPVNVVVAVMAFLCLLVPTIGSFYPVPPFPVNIFPYIFLTYMLAGGVWLFVASRRRTGILTEIAMDLAAAPAYPGAAVEEIPDQTKELPRGDAGSAVRAPAAGLVAESI